MLSLSGAKELVTHLRNNNIAYLATNTRFNDGITRVYLKSGGYLWNFDKVATRKLINLYESKYHA